MTSIVLGWAASMAISGVPGVPQAIYRCPALELTPRHVSRLLEETGFDGLCAEPKLNEVQKASLGSKLSLVGSKEIDTAANRKWRDATISFARGEISPAEWIRLTKNLKSTIHFLSSPKTRSLRDTMADVPVPPMGTFSGRSVFAELFLLGLPGRVCLTSLDVWTTRELPDAGKLQSWVLAMNDLLGPMLSHRSHAPNGYRRPPKVLRADRQPGMLVFEVAEGNKTWTMYLNNARAPVNLPPLPDERVSIHRGWNVDVTPHQLMDTGFLVVEPPE